MEYSITQQEYTLLLKASNKPWLVDNMIAYQTQTLPLIPPPNTPILNSNTIIINNLQQTNLETTLSIDSKLLKVSFEFEQNKITKKTEYTYQLSQFAKKLIQHESKLFVLSESSLLEFDKNLIIQSISYQKVFDILLSHNNLTILKPSQLQTFSSSLPLPEVYTNICSTKSPYEFILNNFKNTVLVDTRSPKITPILEQIQTKMTMMCPCCGIFGHLSNQVKFYDNRYLKSHLIRYPKIYQSQTRKCLFNNEALGNNLPAALLCLGIDSIQQFLVHPLEFSFYPPPALHKVKLKNSITPKYFPFPLQFAAMLDSPNSFLQGNSFGLFISGNYQIERAEREFIPQGQSYSDCKNLLGELISDSPYPDFKTQDDIFTDHDFEDD